MKLSEKNYAHVESLRSMLFNDITEYLQQHHNEIEVLVQGDILLDGTVGNNDDEYISYVYTSIKIAGGDLVAEGYSHFIGDDIKTPCQINSDALSLNELLNIMNHIDQ